MRTLGQVLRHGISQEIAPLDASALLVPHAPSRPDAEVFAHGRRGPFERLAVLAPSAQLTRFGLELEHATFRTPRRGLYATAGLSPLPAFASACEQHTSDADS